MKSGVFTALVTPFVDTGFGIDEKVFRKLIERQINAGVQGLVIAGSTGEGQTMTDKEWTQALQIACSYRSQIEVMASCGSSATWQTLEKAKAALEIGAHSLLISSPPYNKPTQEGIIRHFEEVAKACPQAEIMVYNIPGRTAVNISPASLQSLWKIPNVVALKESSGNWSQFLQMMKEAPKSKKIFSGDDPLNPAFFCHGAMGTVSVLSNVFPEVVVDLWNLCEKSNMAGARELLFSYHQLTEFLFVESNPIPVKWAVSQLIGVPLKPRLPLTELSSKYHAPLKQELDRLRELAQKV